MEHFKSRNNDFFHFTNPQDDVSEMDDDDYDGPQYYDVDDDRSCDFNFHNFHPIRFTPSPPPNSQTSGMINQNNTETTSMEEHGTFDTGTLILHLDDTMKNLSDKLQHTIVNISTKISHLEDETCKLDKHVENVKNSDEKYHGTTHMKLRQMQSDLQEVQDGVSFLIDKHVIAETQLQLAKLQTPITPKTPKTNKAPVSYQPDPRFPHITQSYPLNSYQGIFSPQNHLSYSSSNQSSRNYKSEFHAKYMP